MAGELPSSVCQAHRQHELLCRLFGAAPIVRHRLSEPVSDFSFWRRRLAERRGEVVFGLTASDGSSMVLTHDRGHPAPDVFRVPSGGIDAGETAADSLSREVGEELGASFEVWRYAGLIQYLFTVDASTFAFESYCFLLRAPDASTSGSPPPKSLVSPPMGGEIDRWMLAGPEQLAVMSQRLAGLGGDWADWGAYRAASARLVARCWQTARGQCSEGSAWPRDLSLPVSPAMAVFPGDPRPQHRSLVERTEGHDQGWQVSTWQLPAHAGTHVDAPLHWLAHGIAVDKVPLSRLCGPALVVDCRAATASRRPVSLSDLRAGGLVESAHAAGRIVLVRLGLGDELAKGSAPPEHLGLGAETAEALVASGALAVGIESLSVDPPGADADAHRILLAAGLPVIEGLNLDGLGRGVYWLDAAPLRLVGSEAAPCRALLWPLGERR